jgi:SAM-dependent methyltransferase
MGKDKEGIQDAIKKDDREELAASYGDLMRRRATGEEDEMAQVKQLMKLLPPHYSPGMSVLDVGCGAGHFLRSLRSMDPDILYQGVDINREYIGIAGEVFANCPNASFKTMPVSRIAYFDSKSFDLSINYMVLPFIHDYKSAVREQMRVTKRTMFLRLMLGDHTCIIKRYKWGDSDFIYYNIYSQKEFVNFCRLNGARDIVVYGDDFSLDIPYSNSWDTYTHHGLQVSGNIVLDWKVVVIEL